ncbi:hypothetical protein BN1080_00371 [Planococcus massiliensis]|uniref:Putative zinc-finger domain-containing protein n=1 Tax=Planococcus massiliensis TaxID=1499687 RepID=A0A098EJI8_9BACL|nr:zf-HC2 domain-containing protein [Planococcus massiliensis]CEG21461.1 hypothetical protein BN1080_00371 [Planococcus massiliensis]
MKEVKCTIIQDILPLYVDEVIGPDTKEMVEDHLQHCLSCQQELESMKRDLILPAENNAAPLQTIHRKWRNKKWMISLASVLTTAILLAGVFSYALYYESVIPYSGDLVQIEGEGGELVARYYGKSYATVYETHPMLLEVDGESKNVSFIYYTKTMVDGPSRNLINTEKTSNENGYTFNIVESEKVDAVYYAHYDIEDITEGEDSWESVLKRADLIWEK